MNVTGKQNVMAIGESQQNFTPLSNIASPANEAPSQYLIFTRFQL